ncbi:Chaperone protein DnaJ [Hordeum vulgare]|nr:Chaperone protein DnaJ [Hordeum vulgare]
MEPEAEARAGAMYRGRRWTRGLPPPRWCRSAREAEEDGQRRRRDEEIDTVLYEQGVASALAFGDKVEEWRREATTQERIYVELSSSDDDN